MHWSHLGDDFRKTTHEGKGQNIFVTKNSTRKLSKAGKVDQVHEQASVGNTEDRVCEWKSKLKWGWKDKQGIRGHTSSQEV